jgi:hypothetical protein
MLILANRSPERSARAAEHCGRMMPPTALRRPLRLLVPLIANLRLFIYNSAYKPTAARGFRMT